MENYWSYTKIYFGDTKINLQSYSNLHLGFIHYLFLIKCVYMLQTTDSFFMKCDRNVFSWIEMYGGQNIFEILLKSIYMIYTFKI